MAKYKVIGIPQSPNKSVGPQNRKISNVEAEKDETLVTNFSRGLNNFFEMYKIGGKKHSAGGTPLKLPTNDGDENKNSSFIFSDSKKMIVKDPNVLKYFGMDPKKPLTFAEISNSWLPQVNDSKAILIDDKADAISKKSAELTMSNAAFKISALQLLQESRKGFKQGVSDGLNPFFDKLQVDPSSLFSLDEKGADNMNKAVEAAFGGMIPDFNNVPSYEIGGQPPCGTNERTDPNTGKCISLSDFNKQQTENITKNKTNYKNVFSNIFGKKNKPDPVISNSDDSLLGDQSNLLGNINQGSNSFWNNQAFFNANNNPNGSNSNFTTTLPGAAGTSDDNEEGSVDITKSKQDKLDMNQDVAQGLYNSASWWTKTFDGIRSLDKNRNYATLSSVNKPPLTAGYKGQELANGQQFSDLVGNEVLNPTESDPYKQISVDFGNVQSGQNFSRFGGDIMENGGRVLQRAATGAAMKEQNLNDITVNYNKNDKTVTVTEDEIKAPADPQPEWSQHKDPTSGQLFYYNYITKASSWTLPADATFTAYVPPAAANVESKSEVKESVDSEGAVWGSDPAPKVQYDYIINKLATNDEFKEALYQEYLDASTFDLNFGHNYQTADSRNKVVRKSKEEVFNDYKKFQKRNLVFQSHGLDVQGTQQRVDKKNGTNRVSNNELHEWATKYGVEFEDIDTATSEQLSFIAFENLVADKEAYSNKLQKVMSPFGSKPRGLDDETVMGPDGKPLKGRISKADGYYTNTTSGEVSWFTDPGPDVCPPCPDGTIPVKLPDGTCPCPVITKDPGPCPACPDGTIPVRLPDGSCPCDPNYKKLPDPRTIVNPYDFRRQDIAAVNRAKNALWEIPKISPYGKASVSAISDRAYYSPERAINARLAMLNEQQKLQSNFANASGAGADFSKVAGQAYNDVADTISNYADKNVSIYNEGARYDTALAKQNNDAVVNLSNSIYDKSSILKQNLANSISAAKDKITQLSGLAYENAANIYNLNITNENFKKDPYSGIVYKANDRPITPTSTTAKDFGKEFNAFQAKMPSVTGDLAMKAFLAYKSGKYTITTDDGVKDAGEVDG